MQSLTCINLIAWGLACSFNPPSHNEPQAFHFGKVVDTTALAYVRHLEPALPRFGPKVVLKPVEKPAKRRRQRADKPREAIQPTAEPVAAYAAAEGRGLGGIIDRLFNDKSEEPGVLYVKADGNEVMGCIHKNKYLMDTMRAMRRKWGKPVIVTSAYRSPAHNARVHGADHSYHMSCRALDVRIDGVGKETLRAWLRARKGMGGVGIYCSSYIHFDDGRERNWDWRYDRHGKRKCK